MMRKSLFARRRPWLRRGIDTYLALPVFAGLLLLAIWLVTFHEINNERAHAQEAVSDSLRELMGTYEAQVSRSLDSIDQTLRVVKYAVERKGALGAFAELERVGLLPPGVVFNVSIVDRNGQVVASRPRRSAMSVADQPYFSVHQERDSGATYVSPVSRDVANNDWHVHFTRRLDDALGNFAGIVIVETDPAYFTSSYERSRLGELGMLGLVGSDGIVRALRTGDKLTFGQRLSSDEFRRLEGVERYSDMRELHGVALNVVVGLAEQEAMSGFERQRKDKLWQAGIASAVLALGTTLLCLWAWQGARHRTHVRRAQETYAAATAASMDAFFVLRAVYDSHGEICDFAFFDTNSRAEKMIGHSKEQLRGMTLCGLSPQARSSAMFAGMVRVMQLGGVHEQEWENNLPQLKARWLHQQMVAVEGGVVAIVRDISERKLAEERMLHLAHHDTLTGLPNRSMIGARLEQAIAQAHRHNSALLVAFIDLDGFKLVNDSLGHNAGDELLKVVAERMAGCLRAGDVVGRFGGDEFVLLLNESYGVEAAPVLERVREAVLEAILLCDQEVQVSCSIGVAVYPDDGADAETLLMHADTAMYRAKDTGKNNCQFYTREMNATIERKLHLLEGLRNAVDDGQFQLVYQPKVDLRSGHIFGVEALVRWAHPEYGLLGPDRFIPLAEESGMIFALGEWVLQTACRQNQLWQEAGLPPLRISVNVSPRQFEEQRLVQRVAQALEESGLAPEWLELEVTEGVIMRDLQQAVAKMGELRAMGISLSIDDFGTGYSSLSALKSFPISTLKIDKSFVRDLGSNAGDEAIASSIIGLAHQLRLRVIAEGVETEEQRAFLRHNGCDEMQGYLFSRPLAPEQLRQLLLRQMPASAGLGRLAPALA
ncbi:bifunctional diguanylate cyclase/phosphodiesterase [Duganella qianjiadongensis]|nr:EAL domain-containing protein [Duganella qianjiadongensis]